MSATIQRITRILPHPDADRLELAHVEGYECIVGKGAHQPGDFIVFIAPDSVVPQAEWSNVVYPYTSKGRVKAAKLRGVWSMGLVMPLSILAEEAFPAAGGEDVSELLGITEYESPLPQNVEAKGGLPFGMPKTDEERWQGVRHMPWGIRVDVTLKVDGSSFTAYCALSSADEGGGAATGICSRTQELRLGEAHTNPWVEAARTIDVLTKLESFCVARGVSLALRGEVYGPRLQVSKVNPHCRRERGVAFFSVWNIDTREYEDPLGPLGYVAVCDELGLEAVPTLEHGAILTPELVRRYGDELEEVGGEPFEGVVLKSGRWSCKVINKAYDARK